MTELASFEALPRSEITRSVSGDYEAKINIKAAKIISPQEL